MAWVTRELRLGDIVKDCVHDALGNRGGAIGCRGSCCAVDDGCARGRKPATDGHVCCKLRWRRLKRSVEIAQRSARAWGQWARA